MSLNSYRYRNGLPLATEVASIRPVSFVKLSAFSRLSTISCIKSIYLVQPSQCNLLLQDALTYFALQGSNRYKIYFKAGDFLQSVLQ